MHTLRQYLISLADSYALTRTLGEIEVCRDAQGQICYSVGNSAVVFRIQHKGRIRSLRCYFSPPRHLAEIYGERLLPRELFIYTSPSEGAWVDVVLGEWIEGITLQKAVEEAAIAGDKAKLRAFAASFDALAAELLSAEWAHGDLKPENIIVDTNGALHTIDFDTLFLPQFAGETSPGIGTAAFQHPARSVADFDASIDDYSIALISTALHALSLKPELYLQYSDIDGLLFTPQRIRSDAALAETLVLFECEGLALQYRIGRLLYSPTLRLAALAELFALKNRKISLPICEIPGLFIENGLCGYRTAEQIIIPPLYDCGFDFSEGLAAVQIASSWHFIDVSGEVRLHAPKCEAVKPFRKNRAQIIRNNRKMEMDTEGNLFEI